MATINTNPYAKAEWNSFTSSDPTVWSDPSERKYQNGTLSAVDSNNERRWTPNANFIDQATYGVRGPSKAQSVVPTPTPTPAPSVVSPQNNGTTNDGLLYSNSTAQSMTNTPPTIGQVAGYTPTTATAVTAQTRDNVVTPQATSQYQLNQMLQSGSPLMENAATSGYQAGNRRGLLNSSMSVEAAQAAMIKAATPFAQQDAQTNAAANQANATAANQAYLQDAQAGTSVNVSNAGALTAASANTAANQNENTRLAAQLQQQANLANTDNAMKLRLQEIQSNTSMSIADKQIASQKVLAENENATRLSLQQIQSNTSMSIADKQLASNQLIAKGDNDNKLIIQSIDNASKLGLATLDNETKIKLSNLDTESRKDIALSAQANQQLLQTNITAGNLFNQYLKNIADIASNDKMDEYAKRTAINNQIGGLNAGLAAAGDVSKLDLSKYFQVEGVITPNQGDGTWVGPNQPGGPNDLDTNRLPIEYGSDEYYDNLRNQK